MAAQNSPFSALMRHSDILVALAVITIVVMMIIPLPPVILDIFLALNITLALIVVMVAIYNVEPLQFSVFPSLLLITTPLRLPISKHLLRQSCISISNNPLWIMQKNTFPFRTCLYCSYRQWNTVFKDMNLTAICHSQLV